ncbi:MAG: SpoIIE family protein phosphatase [Epsilonproteobacteria bacterium]|nr:SpoIIE family protein phosphatase [Campylobacterota bacterium]
MTKSIAYKTALNILGMMILIGAVVSVFIFYTQHHAIEELKKFNEESINRIISKNIEEEIKVTHKNIKNIIKSSLASITNTVYTADIDDGKDIIKDLLKIPQIKAISIYDSEADTVFLAGYKDNKIHIVYSLPQKYKKLLNITYPLIKNKVNIGFVTVYYDINDVIQKLNKIKEEELKLNREKLKKLHKKIRKKVLIEIVIILLSVIFISLWVFFLLEKYVNKPIKTFQKGLQSFFNYLQNPHNKVEKIDINSDDEIGDMARSVNKSIEVSVKLRNELENLMNNLEELVKERTKELEIMHKQTQESIKFASLIQKALLKEEKCLLSCFKDGFIIWQPRDIVGGDIYLFEKLRNENECIMMVIDCTGHGVPGAFVTMIVKAIEREIIKHIKDDKLIDISPADILTYFNNSIKKLLRQEDKTSTSNAGFDGGVIYYNRNKQILKFAGAQTPLFYVEEGEVKILKGDRKSVGYKQCKYNQEYTEYTLKVKEGMKFYITTDGYLDQIGGEKDFPFGKKRFKNLINDIHNLPMQKQKEIFIKTLKEYSNDEQNDDVTVIGFEIDQKTQRYEIFEYSGIITQNVISSAIDVLEANIHNISLIGKLSTIVIETLQNIMKYSKTIDENSQELHPYGYIKIIKDKDSYIIITKNIVNKTDKETIEKRLKEIQNLDIKEIKKRYKELRKSGEHTHENGGGIGFYEIAKLAANIEYKFEEINQDKFYFIQKITVQKRK